MKKILSWIFFIGCLAFIFFFSAQNGTESSSLSNDVISLFGNLSIDSTILSFFIRKLAHFTEYMILSISLFHLVMEYRPMRKKEILFVILFCVFYAFTDEFHQLFIAGRNGNIFDVIIDSCGANFGVVLSLILSKKGICHV